MQDEVELKIRPRTANQLWEALVAAAPRVAALFGDEARELKWEPAAQSTTMLDGRPERRLWESVERLAWRNGYLHFCFEISAKYYEGEPRLYDRFVFTLIKPGVIGFGLIGTERPGQPITTVTFGWGFITDAQAAALREVFAEVLGSGRKRERARRRRLAKQRSPSEESGRHRVPEEDEGFGTKALPPDNVATSRVA